MFPVANVASHPPSSSSGLDDAHFSTVAKYLFSSVTHRLSNRIGPSELPIGNNTMWSGPCGFLLALGFTEPNVYPQSTAHHQH